MSQNSIILAQMNIFLLIIQQAYNTLIIYKGLNTNFRIMTIEKTYTKFSSKA